MKLATILSFAIVGPLIGATPDYILDAYRLPTNLDPPWKPGVYGGITNYPRGIILTNSPYNLDPTGVTNCDVGMAQAITDETNGKSIYLPTPGNYKFTNSIRIPPGKNIHIVSDNPSNTWIRSTIPSGGTYDTAIMVGGSTARVTPDVTSGYSRGSTSIVVSSSSGMFVGQYCILRHKTNDSAVVYGPSQDSNGMYQGQGFKVTSISGTTIGIDRPLYWSNYNASFGPFLWALTSQTEWSGVENIGIDCSPSSAKNHAIYFWGAVNCYFKNIIATNANEETVVYYYSGRNQVTDSDIENHNSYSSSSRYSVVYANMATDNLTMCCICEGNNLGVVTMLGACGNVTAYCYSHRGFGVGYPTDNAMKGGYNSHGDNPNYNLFEGNVTPWAQEDSFWGASRYETIVLSHLTRQSDYDTNGNHSPQGNPAIYIEANNHYHSAVGNILGLPRDVGTPVTNAYVFGYDRPNNIDNADPLSLSTFLGHENYNFADGSTTIVPGLSTNIPYSWFLGTNKPTWFKQVTWPVGTVKNSTITNLTLATVYNPAMARYYGINIEAPTSGQEKLALARSGVIHGGL